MDKDIKYVLNNKIYNITQSEKLYEYKDKEPSGMIFMGKYPMQREVKIRIYRSVKNNLYKAVISNGRISIVDITDNEFKTMLLNNNELDLLRELYPEEFEKLEEV